MSDHSTNYLSNDNEVFLNNYVVFYKYYQNYIYFITLLTLFR